ncbi:MAG: acetylglutamate kinase [Clostridiales Family XIII bacterium]|jgi:acetylglutamate kinase|nr:acetylglutamate kinase [Clostridiales Family XIII bacterium]
MKKKKLLVIKLGGAAMTDDTNLESICLDIISLSKNNNIILVHGGGPYIKDYAEKLNFQTRFVEGLRYTDEKILDLAIMILAGKINKNLVAILNKNDDKAIGLSGVDGKLFLSKIVDKDKLGFVGEVISINSNLFSELLNNEYLPVISSLGIGENGQILNINADVLATKIAEEFKADNLIFLSNIKGVLSDLSSENSLIPEIKTSEIAALIDNKIITSGMIPKILAAKNAVRNGVKEVQIISGENNNLLNLSKKGTRILKS